MMMSPTLMPMRKSSRLSGATPALRSAMPRCTSTAQRTASTTLENSSNRPSPVVLTMRPSCSAILGSMSSRRWAFSAASVPLSSTPMRREYPATSSETIAASRRWSRATYPSPVVVPRAMVLNRRQPRNVPPTLLTSVRNGIGEPLNDRYRRRCAAAAPGRVRPHYSPPHRPSSTLSGRTRSSTATVENRESSHLRFAAA